MSTELGTNAVDRKITYSSLSDDLLTGLEKFDIDAITATGWQLVKNNVVVEVRPRPAAQFEIYVPKGEQIVGRRNAFVTAVMDAARLLEQLSEAQRLRTQADSTYNAAINAARERAR